MIRKEARQKGSSNPFPPPPEENSFRESHFCESAVRRHLLFMTGSIFFMGDNVPLRYFSSLWLSYIAESTKMRTSAIKFYGNSSECTIQDRRVWVDKLIIPTGRKNLAFFGGSRIYQYKLYSSLEQFRNRKAPESNVPQRTWAFSENGGGIALTRFQVFLPAVYSKFYSKVNHLLSRYLGYFSIQNDRDDAAVAKSIVLLTQLLHSEKVLTWVYLKSVVFHIWLQKFELLVGVSIVIRWWALCTRLRPTDSIERWKMFSDCYFSSIWLVTMMLSWLLPEISINRYGIVRLWKSLCLSYTFFLKRIFSYNICFVKAEVLVSTFDFKTFVILTFGFDMFLKKYSFSGCVPFYVDKGK